MVTWVDVGGGQLQIGIRAWLRSPWVNVFVMHTCWFICVPYAFSPCVCCIFMVLIMVVVMSSCEGLWCRCGMCHHEYSCQCLYVVMHAFSW